MMANLFGSHVEWRPCWLLHGKRLSCALDDGKAKVTEHDLAFGVEQEILWFDIAVDHALLVSIV